MGTTKKTSLSIPQTLCYQAEILAQHLNISRNHLFRLAIENFIDNSQHDNPASQSEEAHLIINQGDIFWLQLAYPDEAEPGIRHPYVVVQENVFNHSRIYTLVVCALTSNIKRATMPGNVLLDVGEANLTKQSVVEVSKVSTVDKSQLGDYIGSLTEPRISEILAGMRFLQQSYFER